MKTLGIVGGIGPESTVVYYRAIVALYRERKPEGGYPSILINSVDLDRLVDRFEAGDLASVAEYLAAAVGRLASAGADFGLLAANTPHTVFDEVQRRSPIPLISIVEATCEAARARGLTRLGLFGTRFTMQGRFYPEVFSRAGITLALPEPDEQAYLHEKYMGELVPGVVLPETRERLLAIAERLRQRHGIQGLILGGTELSLILGDGMAGDLPLLDTTEIHARSAVERLLA